MRASAFVPCVRSIVEISRAVHVAAESIYDVFSGAAAASIGFPVNPRF
jgi:hypothetical protein